jgi:hypothetical protein
MGLKKFPRKWLSLCVLTLFLGLYGFGIASKSSYCKYEHAVISDDGSVDPSINLTTFNPTCEPYVYQSFIDTLNFLALLTVPVLALLLIMTLKARSMVGLILGTLFFAFFTWSDIDGIVCHVDRLFLFAKPVSDFIFLMIGYGVGKLLELGVKRVRP